MLMTAHGATAALLITGYAVGTKNPEVFKRSNLVLAFFAGILPDIPLMIVVLAGKFTPAVHHHEWITHTPIFWAVIAGIIALRWSKAALLIIGATWAHLAMDWYGGGDGIAFLYPFSHHQYGILLSGVHGPESQQRYLAHWYFLAAEILLPISVCVLMLWTGRIRDAMKRCFDSASDPKGDLNK